ncbi:AI-2E family transporter [Exilibacterium tricleocarpae]|uniref:AI-2E family transporter n=1 Tax=Exilibacterium tricleocarpae TaxID=2591008 RepID=A0A545U9Z7_9GAMM|nr:AI-2E family transporter [Exilibacterium tricleocarpae]TQV86298.1 AI-2E family transporter [Exilibacterium tricleocarpae]
MINIFRSWIDRYFADEEAVLLALFLVAGLIVVVTMGTVLAPMFASLVIAFLMQGMVVRLKQARVPHIVAVTIAFVVLVGMLAASMLVLLPILWHQAVALFSEAPRMLTEWQRLALLLPEKYPQLISETQIEQLINLAGTEVGKFGQNILTFSVANLPVLIAILIYLVLVPILVFFFLKDSDRIQAWVGSFLPKQRPVMSKIWREMNQQIANYVRGKVIEILVVAAVSYVSFVLLGLNYALLMALVVGLSVVIPYIGAAVVTVPVAMIGFFQWGWSSDFFYLLLVYGVIQALDGNVLVPLLFSEAVNLHPVAIILAVLVFGGIWGFWGVFFAIPLATFIKAILNAWPTRDSEGEEQSEMQA